MFKESFKYYKSKNPLPSFEDVVDFSDIQKISNKVCIPQIIFMCSTNKTIH